MGDFVRPSIRWYRFGAGARHGLFIQPSGDATSSYHEPGKLFFPQADALVGTLLAFSTFAVGFAARPLGGVVFGHLGDKVGRKPALVTALFLMGGSTTLIGMLPTYASIGVLAPVVLVPLRLVQGIAVGGQWGGAVLIATENAPAERRGRTSRRAGWSPGPLFSSCPVARSA